MGKIRLTFHGDLVYFLRKGIDSSSLEITFNHKTAIKHIIESLGIPHPEIHRIVCNRQDVDLSYPVQDGDEIQVFHNTPDDPRVVTNPPKFVLDNHLGKLTVYLRLLGFDAVYAQDWPDQAIAQCAQTEERILLTRDRGLLMRKIVEVGRCVRADDPLEQLAEVVVHFGLESAVTPFQRCPRCNDHLIPVAKEEIIDQLLPLTRKYYHEFTRCAACGQIYWKGSHYDHMLKLLAPYTGKVKDES